MSTHEPKICDKPGCGLPTQREDRLLLTHPPQEVWRCRRDADAHALCARVAELEAKLANPMTRNEMEAIAREVYKADRFRDTDQVWCNLTWLTRFAQAIERHHGITKPEVPHGN